MNIHLNQQGCQIRKTTYGESVRIKPKSDPHFLRTTQLVLKVYILWQKTMVCDCPIVMPFRIYDQVPLQYQWTTVYICYSHTKFTVIDNIVAIPELLLHSAEPRELNPPGSYKVVALSPRVKWIMYKLSVFTIKSNFQDSLSKRTKRHNRTQGKKGCFQSHLKFILPQQYFQYHEEFYAQFVFMGFHSKENPFLYLERLITRSLIMALRRFNTPTVM
jgi:hypothetical protein